MIICIPELNNKIVQSAILHFPDLKFIGAENLDHACSLVKSGQADTILSGLDYSSRAVLLAYKKHFSLASKYFSSSFVCAKNHQYLVLADGAVNKLPTKQQLFAIVEDSANTFITFCQAQPKIAMLSYSTNGSGGKNPDLDKIHYVIEKIRQNYPDWLIDGEMQLDAALDPEISTKKFPASQIVGAANILITPDLNSGNLLYKAMERFGGWTIAGPLIQGFEIPLADLSRGSTAEDASLTIRVLAKLCERDRL